ncbi:MAG TPA: hypothetical protein VF753_08930 [Terriglobales bacterium]
MVNDFRVVTLTTTTGFRALVKYEMNGDFWLKDVSGDEWYCNYFHEGNRFRRLVEGRASHELREGEEAEDRNLLAALREVKYQYIESQIVGRLA